MVLCSDHLVLGFCHYKHTFERECKGSKFDEGNICVFESILPRWFSNELNQLIKKQLSL
jgi:hypothetical protein